ncbi:MAG TPA: peptidoglycan DD-metalloendopeptidase family protein [Ignavibacteriaceae bacterium]|nr:peptidoglycan DD-metalloendopeptidase family protein [Ignavibacteriaceae bacterium]
MKNILLLLLICSVSYSQTFRISRPVKDNIPVNASYLYGEPRYQDPQNGHRGIDIAARWDSVYSATDGLVYFVGYNPNDTINGYEAGGAGNYIVIKSRWMNKDIYIYYMHLQKPLIAQNDSVKAGNKIAISGNTGNSTGAHLHFEIRMNYAGFNYARTRRNPELWIVMSGKGAIYGKVPNAPNTTRVDISPDPKPRPPYTTYGYSLTYNFADAYIGTDDIYGENYAIGDVKPGTYTITALNGAYRRVVTVHAGEVVNADPVTYVNENLNNLSFSLEQNYPNPFNPYTYIVFSLKEGANVKLKVYDVLGKEVDVLAEGYFNPGKQEFLFDGSQLSSGIYFYRLESDKFSVSKKMVILK